LKLQFRNILLENYDNANVNFGIDINTRRIL